MNACRPCSQFVPVRSAKPVPSRIFQANGLEKPLQDHAALIRCRESSCEFAGPIVDRRNVVGITGCAVTNAWSRCVADGWHV